MQLVCMQFKLHANKFLIHLYVPTLYASRSPLLYIHATLIQIDIKQIYSVSRYKFNLKILLPYGGYLLYILFNRSACAEKCHKLDQK